MSKYVVSYQTSDSEEKKKIEVVAYNLLHAERVAKEKLGNEIFVLSVSSKPNSQKKVGWK